MKRFDAIVVGSGLTGSWAAKVLSEGGSSVLVLEAGRALDPEQDVGTETWAPIGPAPADDRIRRQKVQSTARAYSTHNAQLWIDDVDHPYETADDAPFSWYRCRQIGGRGVLWGRVALRMSSLEFQPSIHDGVGPDWPLGYTDLAPHYDEIETFHACRGRADGLDWLPDGRYQPPVELTPGEQRLREAVESHWTHRHVIHQRAFPLTHRRPGNAWPIFTPQGSALSAALATGRVELRTDAIVSEIVLDGGSKRARGVRIIDGKTKRDEIVLADTIVLAASAFESVRILLASEGPDGERGLGARSGMLGLGIMDHVTTTCIGSVAGVPAAREVLPFGGTNGAYIPRFQNLPGNLEDEERLDFIRGYGIQVGCQRIPFADGFILVAVGEMLPRRDNRLSLSTSVKDAHGLPVLRIDCRFGDNELAMQEHQARAMRAMVERAGFEVRRVVKGASPGGFAHECGGAICGAKPEESVVDARGRIWECPNVSVVDGAVWPTGGYQNPSLTMMAFAGFAASAILAERRAR